MRSPACPVSARPWGDRVLLGQSRASRGARGAHARHRGHHRHARGRAGFQTRGDARYGGRVVIYDRYRENRRGNRRASRRKTGAPIIPPYDHADIVAGQGTAAAELLEEVGPLDSLFVCLGGGGLLAGSLLAARALAPACKVYGVEPEAGNDGQRSLRQGAIVSIEVPKTIADGAQTQSLGKSPSRSFGATQRTFLPPPTPSSSSACACSPIA